MNGVVRRLRERDAPRPMTLPESGQSGHRLRVSVVVCAYTEERWELLQRAVTSVRCQSWPAHEVLVVIDHNDDLLRRARAGLAARVVPNTDVRGLSGARNTGLALAAGDVIAFLDDDACAEPTWLEHLASEYSDPDVLAVGGDVRPEFEGERPSFLPREFDWVVGCSYEGLPTTRAEVRNLIGANMSYRRQVFDAVGGFEVSLGRIGTKPLGCEETELCIRAAAAFPHGKVVLQPLARVHHRVPHGRTSWRYFLSRCHAEGLSKAAVARLAGARRGLASERRYTTRTLPAGVVRGVEESVRTGRPDGGLRAGAILLGLTCATAGYLTGAVRLRWEERRRRHTTVHHAGRQSDPQTGSSVA